MGPGVKGGFRCGARICLTTKHATDLVWLYSNLHLAAKHTPSLKEQDMAQPSVVPSKEEEEEEGSSSGWTSVMRIRGELHCMTWIPLATDANMQQNRTGERP